MVVLGARGAPMAAPSSAGDHRDSVNTDSRSSSVFPESVLYYLHPGENPALVLVTPPLNASNYLSWSRSMARALRSKKKWGMVDSSIVPPNPEDELYAEWESCNSMVISWLLGSMEPGIAKSVSCLETAVDVWTDLKARFGRGDSMKIARLQLELCSLKQGAISVTDYFTTFRTLWDQFCEFRPLPLCKCVDLEKGSAACESVRIHKLYQENDQVIRFLIGLNENYSTVISQIMLMDPLPDVNRALFLALQHEQHLLNGVSASISAHVSANVSALQAGSTAKKVWNGNRKSAICTYCGKEGHTIEKCYRKHGFPPNFRFTNNNMAGNGSRQYSGSPPSRYASANSVGHEHLQEMNEGFARLALTPEQCNGLIALIQHSVGANHKDNPIHNIVTTDPIHNIVTTDIPSSSSTSVSANHITGPNQFESDW